MSAFQTTQSYNIWVLRIWQESDTGDWRAIVSQSPDKPQHAFSTRGDLIAFLDDAMAAVTSTDAAPFVRERD